MLLGARQFFERRGHQVEYLDVGGYYFITNFYPNNRSSFEMEYALFQGSSNMGNVNVESRVGWQDNAFGWAQGRSVDPKTWGQWGSQVKIFSTPVTAGKKVKCSIGRVSPRAFAYDGNTKWTPRDETFQCTHPCWINAEMLDGVESNLYMFCEMRFYSCKFWDDGVLVCDIVPWVYSSGECVLKNLVTGGIMRPVESVTEVQSQKYLLPGPDTNPYNRVLTQDETDDNYAVDKERFGLP